MLKRRGFLTIAAGLGIAPFAIGQASAADRTHRLTAYIDGAEVDRETVLQWEARRLQVAAQRISLKLPGALIGELTTLLSRPATSTANVARDRELLADAKLRIGEAGIRDLMAPDLAVTGPASLAAAAAGGWSISSAELHSTRGTARGFASWFTSVTDERTMLVACPDHYLIRSQAGVQEVIEVTGGAMLGSRFLIDYADTVGIPIGADPCFPISVSGWARADGVAIGAVRHQFRDDRGGFSAKLAVAFPAALPATMVSEHRWHLVCEFSNWVSAYLA